jgi:2-haloacid dehalogenase
MSCNICASHTAFSGFLRLATARKYRARAVEDRIMPVKALTFDIIGTVFDWFGTFLAGVPPLAHKYGLAIDPSDFANAAKDGYTAGVAAVLNGRPWMPPDEILRSSIIDVLSVYHSPSEEEVEQFFSLWRTLRPWPDVARSLYALRGHFTLAILSNMSLATQSALTKYAGLPFDRALAAETVREYKPNRAVYEMAIASLGLEPDEIMLVAAHDYDLTAAKEQGIRTAYVARPSEQGTPSADYDINVTSFTELVHKLGAEQ